METKFNRVRIDKWLWAVRIFKTRSAAAEACKNGKIKINGIAVKPAREISLDEIITVNMGIIRKTYKVAGLIEKRVSAALAAQNCIDITPIEETEKLEIFRLFNRRQGTGRPTKKERRLIVKFKGDIG